MPEQPILEEIVGFFADKFEVCETARGNKFAAYREEWLTQIDLNSGSPDEAKTARTVKMLQENLLGQFGRRRLKIEANVAENMQLRFLDGVLDRVVDPSKLMAFDILDVETGCAFEISLADAFAEFFKDILKGLLDSRVKKLYFCMRNHNYSGAGKSGFVKVATSPMIQQYITLARLYKLEIILVDLFPECNNVAVNRD